MYQYMKDHEAFINSALKEPSTYDIDWLCDYHLKAISFVQHERLIHLLVTFFFALLFMGSIIASLLLATIFYFLLDLICIILLGFYIRHYYRLENTVQRWYELYKKMDFKRHNARVKS